MLLKINTAPEKTKTGTVASLSEVKKQLNIPDEFTDDDEMLALLLDTATEAVESDTHSDLLDTANVLEHDLTAANFSADAVNVPRLIYINQAPVRSVSNIEIWDGSDWTELLASNYNVNAIFNRVEIRLFDNIEATKIKFTFTTGYTDSKRPKRLKQAIILKAADLFDTERSNYVVGASNSDLKTYARLIDKHIRTYW